jgi:hypothetical protein
MNESWREKYGGGCAENMGGERNENTILAGKPEENISLGRFGEDEWMTLK